MPKPRRPRVLVIVSDIHAGSQVALMPPRFRLQNDTVLEHNEVQKFYWEAWCDFQAWLSVLLGKDPFALFLNGDLVEGDHHRTDEIISKKLADHIELAVELLTPLASRAEHVWITKGTECHTGDLEAAIGARLAAGIDPNSGKVSRRVFDRLVLDMCGERFVGRHHITTTSRPWLESNGLGMELAAEQLSAVRNGERMPRIIACAHRHVPGYVKTTGGICVVSGAWQGRTRHTHNKVPAARCQPAAYVLDWRGVPDGELPMVHERKYEAPAEISVTV